VRVIRGPLLSEVHVFFSQVQHILRLCEGPGIEGLAVDIQNLVDVSNENNRELVMRLETSVNNEDRTFYADLNGFQVLSAFLPHTLLLLLVTLEMIHSVIEYFSHCAQCGV
jgi:hypothetical protein